MEHRPISVFKQVMCFIEGFKPEHIEEYPVTPIFCRKFDNWVLFIEENKVTLQKEGPTSVVPFFGVAQSLREYPERPNTLVFTSTDEEAKQMFESNSFREIMSIIFSYAFKENFGNDYIYQNLL